MVVKLPPSLVPSVLAFLSLRTSLRLSRCCCALTTTISTRRGWRGDERAYRLALMLSTPLADKELISKLMSVWDDVLDLPRSDPPEPLTAEDKEWAALLKFPEWWQDRHSFPASLSTPFLRLKSDYLHELPRLCGARDVAHICAPALPRTTPATRPLYHAYGARRRLIIAVVGQAAELNDQFRRLCRLRGAVVFLEHNIVPYCPLVLVLIAYCGMFHCMDGLGWTSYYLTWPWTRFDLLCIACAILLLLVRHAPLPRRFIRS
jgi:hypothetical protein